VFPDQIASVTAVLCNAVKTTVPSSRTPLLYHLSNYAALEPTRRKVLSWQAGERLQQQHCHQQQQHRLQQQ
jgi:hypothetical protein